MKTQILFEDRDLLVCHKPAGIAVQSGRIAEPDMVSELKNYLAKGPHSGDAVQGLKGNPPSANASVYLGIIHRLDQTVSGIVVFAKNRRAAADLSRQVAERKMKKTYRVIVFLPADGPHADMQESREAYELTDYIRKEPGGGACVAGPQEKDAKMAKLSWRCLKRDGQRALLEIELETGRHHQIRVQLANAGMPVLGDNRYGSEESRALSGQFGIKAICLQAAKLAFLHPATQKRVCFEVAQNLEL